MNLLNLLSPELLLLLTGAISPFIVQAGKWLVSKTGATLSGKSVRAWTFVTCFAVTAALFVFTGQSLPAFGGFSGELSSDALVALNYAGQWIVVLGVVYKTATYFYDKALVAVFEKLGWQ